MIMALNDKVVESLNEAESHLRNALYWAAKNERPLVCKQIADMIREVEHIQSFDSLFDTIEKHTDKFKFSE